jgi:hypothetical protein
LQYERSALLGEGRLLRNTIAFGAYLLKKRAPCSSWFFAVLKTRSG